LLSITSEIGLSFFSPILSFFLCLTLWCFPIYVFPKFFLPLARFHHTVDGTGQDIAIYCSPRVLLGVSKDSRSASYLRTEVDVVELDERIETMVSQFAGNPLPRLEGGS
jgi:hypothetical protein